MHNTLAEGTVSYQTQPSLWRRFLAWLVSPPGDDEKIPEWRPRYVYSPGMDKPDARFHAIPGAVARKREEAARKARLK